ncbi:unnamed protein product [Trifolium pratense]|uniref:Uncharacterized protein n=1 Tax=Trifolium pratense TaxID=57577 RepID=A0ACB0M1Z3_TRIPR|nr:unnamed protein product [Trifolium pratense]
MNTVPPQYLHKCSGGLFRVGTIVESPKEKKTNKKRKVQNYSLPAEVLFENCDHAISYVICESVKRTKSKTEMRRKKCINIYVSPITQLEFC